MRNDRLIRTLVLFEALRSTRRGMRVSDLRATLAGIDLACDGSSIYRFLEALEVACTCLGYRLDRDATTARYRLTPLTPTREALLSLPHH